MSAPLAERVAPPAQRHALPPERDPELEVQLRKGAVFAGVIAEDARVDAARQALEAAGAARILG